MIKTAILYLTVCIVLLLPTALLKAQENDTTGFSPDVSTAILDSVSIPDSLLMEEEIITIKMKKLCF